MKTTITKISAILLAALMLLGTVTACSNATDDPGADSGKNPANSGAESSNNANPSETEEEDEIQNALDALGEIDYGGRNLTIYYQAGDFKAEIAGVDKAVAEEGSTDQVLNDAVYARNLALNSLCNLKVTPYEVTDINAAVSKEALAKTGDFQFIDAPLVSAATSYAPQAYLSDWVEMGIDLDGEWWDQGTASFVLNGGVYFMSGSLNFVDDNMTYVLIFNKTMRESYPTIVNPYDTVREDEWTLSYFNTIIQGVSANNGTDGSSEWNENDTYGFITTWETGNTFFISCGLHYVELDEEGDPTLYLAEQSHMDKALQVLDLTQAVFHDNNATFMSPAGQEQLGLTAFREGRGMFYSEIVSYLSTLNADMDQDFGIVPFPKYDKNQENYNTWTYNGASTFSIINSIPEGDKDTVGRIMQAYAILSHQYVKPVHYDTVVTTRNVRDGDSAEMLDLIFRNRVYDMGLYFTQFDLFPLFRDAVNDDSGNFSSQYTTAVGRGGRTFNNQMNALLRKLQK